MAAPAAATNKHQFTKEQVAEYQDNFKEFDADGSGTIEPKELKAVLEKCGVETSDAQVNDLIKDSAKGGKEELDFEDFLVMMWKMQSGPSEKELRSEIFTVSHLQAHVPNCAGTCTIHPGLQCLDWLARASTSMFVWLQMLDDNMDGLVTFEELRTMFKKAFAETKGVVDVPTDEMIRRMLAEAGSDGTSVNFDDINALLDLVA